MTVVLNILQGTGWDGGWISISGVDSQFKRLQLEVRVKSISEISLQISYQVSNCTLSHGKEGC